MTCIKVFKFIFSSNWKFHILISEFNCLFLITGILLVGFRVQFIRVAHIPGDRVGVTRCHFSDLGYGLFLALESVLSFDISLHLVNDYSITNAIDK